MITYSNHSLRLTPKGPDYQFSALFEGKDLVASGFENGKQLAQTWQVKNVTEQNSPQLAEALDQFCSGNDKYLRELTKHARLVGTDLQKQAWNVLSELKLGDVITYTDLANEVGRPMAVRSLASACKKNRQILILGCHRVTKLNGETGKYAYGKPLKKELLAFEASF